MKSSLAGKTILITRPEEQEQEFRRLLEAMGARVVQISTIKIVGRVSQPTLAAVKNLPSYDWLIFTSVNGVRFFLEALQLAQVPVGKFPRTACIGPATAQAARRSGLAPELVPERYQAEGLIEAFSRKYEADLSGLKILIPRAAEARAILPEQLRRLGAEVDVLRLYEAILPEESRFPLQRLLTGPRPDLIAFTSSSTVRNFVKLAEPIDDFRAFKFASIGPITSETARSLGLSIEIEPSRSTIPALADAIGRHFSVVPGN